MDAHITHLFEVLKRAPRDSESGNEAGAEWFLTFSEQPFEDTFPSRLQDGPHTRSAALRQYGARRLSVPPGCIGRKSSKDPSWGQILGSGLNI